MLSFSVCSTFFSLAPFVLCFDFPSTQYKPTLSTLATQHQVSLVSFEIVNKEVTISASLLHLGGYLQMTKGAFDLNTMETEKQSTSKGKSRRVSRIEILENLRKCNGAKATFSPFSQDIFHWHGGAQFLRNSQSKKRRKSSSSCRDSLNGAGIAGFYKSLHSLRLEEQLEGATRNWEVKVAPKIRLRILMKNVLHIYCS